MNSSSEKPEDVTAVGPNRSSPPSTPRWVKIFGIVAAVIVVVLVIGLLTGGHGPGRHTPQSPVAQQHITQP